MQMCGGMEAAEQGASQFSLRTDMFRGIKSRRTKWAGYVVHVRDKECLQNVPSEIRSKFCLRDLSIGERMTTLRCVNAVPILESRTPPYAAIYCKRQSCPCA